MLEEEDEDGGYYYLPVIQPQQPVEENCELDNTSIPVVQPSEPEKEREETDLEMMANDDETAAQMENGEVPQQEVVVMEEQPQRERDDGALTEGNSDEEQGSRWPRRERRPPENMNENIHI